jgi:DHA1 family L-arabinose/isopropyl-beta-D-thiogalactopyranoside export protein-like MFS transporter
VKHIKEWLPVLGLALTSFIFVSSEFSPVGLLPQIAKSIGETEATTGLIMTVYAWCVAVVSLPLMLLTAKIERRKLLVILVFVFAVGNLMVGLANEFYVIIAARLVIAFSHALFWAISMPLAARLAPYGKYSYGLSTVSGGVAFAVVLGMPLGKFIGDKLGWHSTFFSISAIAFIIMVVIRFTLPKVPSLNAGSLKSLPVLFSNKALIAAYFVVVLMITGHFATYTYVVPFMADLSGFSEDTSTIILFLYGLAGIVGILTANKFMEKYLREMLIGSTLFIVLSLFVMYFFHTSVYALSAVLCVWSIAMSIFSLTMNLWVLRLVPKTADAAMAIYSGIFNVGIGGGALLGGLAITHFGLDSIGYVGALFALPTILIVTLFAKNKRDTQ